METSTNGTLRDEQQILAFFPESEKGKARYWKAWLLLFIPVTEWVY